MTPLPRERGWSREFGGHISVKGGHYLLGNQGEKHRHDQNGVAKGKMLGLQHAGEGPCLAKPEGVQLAASFPTMVQKTNVGFFKVDFVLNL